MKISELSKASPLPKDQSGTKSFITSTAIIIFGEASHMND